MIDVIDDFTGDYLFLSNFAMLPCEYEGLWYPSSEHAYQAAKSLIYKERKAISELKTPAESKHEGRRVKMRDDWEAVKDGVMFSVLLDKFTRNKKVFLKLMATGDAELVEGNTWHDNYWGDCSCERCCKKSGRNKLGQILMHIRNRFNLILGE